jgi:aldehyde:ferredoxin oxidoreductase
LKRAGYDLLVIQGKSEQPVWLNISPDEIAIRDAGHLWGKTTHEAELALRKEDSKRGVLSIGPAGERLVRFACLTHNYFRNFGRGGLGAVFGAKQLKAIAVRGNSEGIPIPDPDQVDALSKQLIGRARAAKEKGHDLHYHGTPWLVWRSNNAGMFPTRNFQTTHFEHHLKLSPDRLEGIFAQNRRRQPCERCPISCSWVITKTFPWAPGEETGAVPVPEYETLGLLGGNLGLADAEAVIQANHLCNILGLDTISTGNVIGLLMELESRGELPAIYQKESIEFGDGDGVIQLVRKIGLREGLGDNLAEGTMRFAQKIGTKATPLAMHVKGLEFPAWDPRGKLGLGLSYATAAAGASHLRGWPVTSETPQKSAVSVLPSLVEQQDLKILKDSLIICHFTHSIDPPLDNKDCANIYNVVTGENASEDAVRGIAARIWLLARLFNIREFDIDPRHFDQLPVRLMKEPVPSGPTKGRTAFVSRQDFEKCLTELYHLRGCDDKGHPTPTVINRLGLEKLYQKFRS